MADPSKNVLLSSIVPTPYNLVYAVPLLVASLPLTFTGAFLTLDRTRTFAPQADVDPIPGEFDLKNKKSGLKSWWGLEGGVGGLAGGWACGAHLATFVSLLIMNLANDPPLTPVQFLLIQIITSLLFTFLGGRFKIAALSCIGLAGGVSFALIISVVLHPSLLTRLIFVAIITPLSTIVVLLPIVRTQHGALRFAAASTGSFGITVSIALLARKSSWANVWERLWRATSPADDWGSSIEHGLSAFACLMLTLGIVTDWFIRKKIGENPDQKWDSYLARYASSLPNNHDRAGSFRPVLSLWQRLFQSPVPAPVVFPSDVDLKSAPTLTTHANMKASPRKRARKSLDVKFRPLGNYSDSDGSDSDTEWEHKPVPLAYPVPARPWLKDERSSTPLSGLTLYGSDDDTDKHKPMRKSVTIPEEYSDTDGEDITTPHSTPLKRVKSHRDEPGWKPDFLKRYSTSPQPSSNSAESRQSPAGAVPMTPSLIRAIDRIAVAQTEAYSGLPPLSPPPLLHAESEQKYRGFWERVQKKASET
ncbi:hypothetical protein BU17DRAFT_71148 [Hysterangium stoloniferum]|nr:hypothetical protein BU17DRAFT_71148 [Hysterangium stoloniferum]